MQEVTGPTLDPLPKDAHLLQPVLERARRDPERAVAAYRDGDRFVDVTARELHDRVRAVAKGLLASGVEDGARVALMSRTRLEWIVCDYAILAVGAATVPVYDSSSAEQLQWILSDSGAVLALLETPAMADMHREVAPDTPACREALVIDDGGLDELARRGEGVDDAALDARIAALTTDHLATIIYTSGTTGRPKGCMLTHGHLRTNVLQNLEAVRPMLGPDEVSLLFLPLAHSLAKIIALVGAEHGVKGAFATDMNHLVEELPMVQPTMVVAVPRVFEKVFNGAQHKAHADGKGKIFDRAADVAVDWSRATERGGRAKALTSVQHKVFDKLVYGKIRDVFGGRLRFAFSGGGPLGERLTHFYRGIGVLIFEGYGLTETSPTLTVNTRDAWKPGTVGRPLADTTIRIAADGEILAKGPQIFDGYWHAQEATDAVLADGWFHTGDIGQLDDEGYLRITGRKKELIVTAAGKNVAPAPLEDRIRAHPLVSQAVVVGDNRPFVAAMVTLDEEALADWATEAGKPEATAAALRDDPDLRAEVQAAIDAANASVSRAESIREVAILPHDLSIENDELTPTLKVRRSIVEKSYADVIDGIYGG
jgi:long-chain acyl-CoA synthetase